MMENPLLPSAGSIRPADIKPDSPEVDTQAVPDPITTTGSTPAGAQETDSEVIARLASMTTMEYDRLRKEEARALGIQISTLDDLVKAARNEDDAADRLPFPEVEPYPDPINPAQLFDEVSDTILRFVVMEKDQADAAALWTAHTHVIDDVENSPLALIDSPEKACAKTLFQEILWLMSHRPLPAANASLSALFRAVELWRPTLFIDEADTFFRDNPELHGMVNAGYKRGGFVLRSEAVGDNYVPRQFSVYGAKSIAGIRLAKHLPDSTMSRGIVFNLRRKMPHEKVARLRHADSKVFSVIVSKLARFADDYSQQIRQARPLLPNELSDRAQDNWEPLLAIAACAGPDWIRRATAAALKLSRASEQSVSTGNELLADIRQVFKGRQGHKISTAALIGALVADEEKGWSSYNHGKPLTPRQLAKQLSGYDIKSKTVRLGHANTPKGYEQSQFADAFARYLPAPLNAPQQRNDAQESNNDIGLDVADETQRSDDDAPGGVADVSPQVSNMSEVSPPCDGEPHANRDELWEAVAELHRNRNASATRKPSPELDCGSVADETPSLEGDDSAHPGAASEDSSGKHRTNTVTKTGKGHE